MNNKYQSLALATGVASLFSFVAGCASPRKTVADSNPKITMSQVLAARLVSDGGQKFKVTQYENGRDKKPCLLAAEDGRSAYYSRVDKADVIEITDYFHGGLKLTSTIERGKPLLKASIEFKNEKLGINERAFFDSEVIPANDQLGVARHFREAEMSIVSGCALVPFAPDEIRVVVDQNLAPGLGTKK